MNDVSSMDRGNSRNTAESKLGVASCIHASGIETLAMNLAPELNPRALNLSIAPVPKGLDYSEGTVATYRDAHFFVIRWNPKQISGQAARVTELRIRSATPGKVFLLCYDMGGWCIERLFSPAEAGDRFRALSDAKDLNILPTTFVQSMELGKPDIATPFIGTVYSLWRQMEEQNCEASKTAFWKLATEHGILISADDDDDKLRISYVGQYAPILRYYGEEWKLEALSLQSANWSAQNRHDTRVSTHYQNVARTGKPRLDVIVGHLDLPNGLSAWVQYQRLSMPIKVGVHIPAVQVFSDLLPNAPFPFLENSWSAAPASSRGNPTIGHPSLAQSSRDRRYALKG